jgi:hypothetical protein
MGIVFGIFAIIGYAIAGKSQEMIREEKNEDMQRLAMMMNAKK